MSSPYESVSDDSQQPTTDPMSSSPDPYETSSDEEDDHRSPQMAGTHSLGLNKNYVLSWRRLHAFREFIQNWSEILMYLPARREC